MYANQIVYNYQVLLHELTIVKRHLNIFELQHVNSQTLTLAFINQKPNLT